MFQAPLTRASPTDAGDTLAERALALIEQAILTGGIAPGSRLAIHHLARRFGMGPTPIREGLSRLVARGLVVAIGQRGFRAAEVSREDLEDISAVRTLTEVEALRRAMARGDDTWEAGIVACLHRLTKLARRSDAGFLEGMAEYDTAHRDFHAALIAACGSPRLLAMHRALYDQAYRYRRVMTARLVPAGRLADEHRELAELVLARDVERACARLAAHLATTLAVVYPDDKKQAARRKPAREKEKRGNEVSRIRGRGGARRGRARG
jgi:DNA-binding GntR family transcriptional regulator